MDLDQCVTDLAVQAAPPGGADRGGQHLAELVMGEVVAGVLLADDAELPQLVELLGEVVVAAPGGTFEHLGRELPADRRRHLGQLPGARRQGGEPLADHRAHRWWQRLPRPARGSLRQLDHEQGIALGLGPPPLRLVVVVRPTG